MYVMGIIPVQERSALFRRPLGPDYLVRGALPRNGVRSPAPSCLHLPHFLSLPLALCPCHKGLLLAALGAELFLTLADTSPGEWNENESDARLELGDRTAQGRNTEAARLWLWRWRV